MSDTAQHAFNAAALDAALLSTPFAVQTNWCAVTGAPCSGKTTLIGALAERGCRTLRESGRAYVEQERTRGRTTGDLIQDGVAMQRGILALQNRSERELPVDQVVFLDGGAPSCLTYLRVLGLDPNAVLAGCFHHRYAAVFQLDRLPFQPDGVRFEDDATAARIDAWLARDYGALGYPVIRVPVLPVPDRVAFILARVAGRGRS